MSFLKGLGKVVGTTVLGATGVASTVLRGVASAAGMDAVADVIGNVQDKSFDTIQDMWTSEEEKTEEYYEKQMEKHADRAESAVRYGEQKRREYERMKKKRGE